MADILIRLYRAQEALCLEQNYRGETAFHAAAGAEALACLEAMEAYRWQSLRIRDVEGENPLFTATRAGAINVFRWYKGPQDFFQARAERNYRG